MDEDIAAFVTMVGIAIGVAAIWHAFVKNYRVALIGAAITGSVVACAAFGLWRGRWPHWIMFIAFLPAYALFAAAVGLPFYRFRAGVPLGHDFRKRFSHGFV